MKLKQEILIVPIIVIAIVLFSMAIAYCIEKFYPPHTQIKTRIKLTEGVGVSKPEPNSIEYDGTNYFVIDSYGHRTKVPAEALLRSLCGCGCEIKTKK